jgi:hypothetical protein
MVGRRLLVWVGLSEGSGRSDEHNGGRQQTGASSDQILAAAVEISIGGAMRVARIIVVAMDCSSRVS